MTNTDKKIASLIKAFRVNENKVMALYFHNERHQEFLIEWNRIHPETGETIDYDLQIYCLSESEELNEIVKNAIRSGESDENSDLELYLNIRDSFDAGDCEDIK